MNKGRDTLTKATELRRRAEDRLQAVTTKGTPALTPPDVQRLVQELQVHQIELEIQSEELWQSRAEAEAELEHYAELYDFAPVGYLAIDRDGAIKKANLAGAIMLGVERARLPGRRFGVFVREPDRPVLNLFFEEVFASRERQACEVGLLKDGGGALDGQRAQRGEAHAPEAVSRDAREVQLEADEEHEQCEAELGEGPKERARMDKAQGEGAHGDAEEDLTHGRGKVDPARQQGDGEGPEGHDEQGGGLDAVHVSSAGSAPSSCRSAAAGAAWRSSAGACACRGR